MKLRSGGKDVSTGVHDFAFGIYWVNKKIQVMCPKSQHCITDL